MEIEHLPLQIASGILIAATVMFAFRYAFVLWREDEKSGAIMVWLASIVGGGALIAAGIGLASW